MKLQRFAERESSGAPPSGPWLARVIRVGIADDHPITRAALRCYLDELEDIRVVAEAASGREAIDVVRTQSLDVLLLDLDMPGQSGIDALTMIKASSVIETSVLGQRPQGKGAYYRKGRRGKQAGISRFVDCR